jgi:hypothetical protein
MVGQVAVDSEARFKYAPLAYCSLVALVIPLRFEVLLEQIRLKRNLVTLSQEDQVDLSSV